MQKTTQNPTNYLKSLPDGVRQDMQTLDAEFSKIMQGQARTLWEGVFWGGSQQTIIGYGDYVYKRPGKPDVEWFVIGLALQKNYLSVYINAVEDDTYIVEKHKAELGKVKAGKSSISFKSLADVNLDALLRLAQLAKEWAAS